VGIDRLKLGIGTVQFGTDYGISNPHGQTPVAEVAKIFDLASQQNIAVVDTAPSYGDSETIIGQTLPGGSRFKIITKTPVFGKKSWTRADALQLQKAFQKSLNRLGQATVYGLLVHHADDLLAEGGTGLMAELLDLKRQGRVEKIGVSVYTGSQIDQVLERFSIDLIQLPLSILDQRLIQSGHLHHLKQIGCEIHVRSIFLQGLLLLTPETLPAFFDSAQPKLREFHQAVRAVNSSPQKAALDFVNELTEVDALIVGLNTVQQLQELILALEQPPTDLDFTRFALSQESILNPAQWQF
jgi:aryl-alcohol dehydrogenase-like predicted oxidoreductase